MLRELTCDRKEYIWREGLGLPWCRELEVESNETCIGESRSDRSIVLRVLTRTTCSWCSL